MPRIPRRLAIIALVIPVLEIAVAVRVGLLIGAPATLLLLLAGSSAGLYLLRRGVVLPGLLLFVPGFLTDVAALVLFIPAVRRRVISALGRSVEARLQRFGAGPNVIVGEVVTPTPGPPHQPAVVIEPSGEDRDDR